MEIWLEGECLWVRKHYHSKFSIQDEVKAYDRLKALLVNVKGVRAARILNTNSEENLLELEFVHGKTLAERLMEECSLMHSAAWPTIVTILIKATERNTNVDLDPQNMIIAEGSGELVIVDPLLEQGDSPHATAVVFFLGLIKCWWRLIHKPSRLVPLAKEIGQLKRAYLAGSNANEAGFRKDIVHHIDKVIRWNVHDSAAEQPLKRLVRMAVIVPFWWMIGCYFRWSARWLVVRGIRASR